MTVRHSEDLLSKLLHVGINEPRGLDAQTIAVLAVIDPTDGDDVTTLSQAVRAAMRRGAPAGNKKAADALFNAWTIIVAQSAIEDVITAQLDATG